MVIPYVQNTKKKMSLEQNKNFNKERKTKSKERIHKYTKMNCFNVIFVNWQNNLWNTCYGPLEYIINKEEKKYIYIKKNKTIMQIVMVEIVNVWQ